MKTIRFALVLLFLLTGLVPCLSSAAIHRSTGTISAAIAPVVNAPVKKSYALFHGGSRYLAVPYGGWGSDPVYVGTPYCLTGYSARVTSAIRNTDDFGSCRIVQITLLSSIAKISGGYRVANTGSIRTESGCNNRGYTYHFNITCVPNEQVEARTKNQTDPNDNICAE